MTFANLDESVLIELTNAGTVRRARKELDQVDIVWTEQDGGWVATSSDDTVQHLGVGHFDTWTCSCPAEHKCRHIVRAVLAFSSDPSNGPTIDPTINGEPVEKAPSSPTPSAASEASPTEFFTVRTRRDADRILARGLIAQVSRSPKLLVRLLHPVHLNVRFTMGEDLRYARCECGVAACLHLALAEAVAREPGLSSDTDGRLVRIGALAAPVPADAVRAARGQWDEWLGQLLDSGLGAVDHLLGGVVRTATLWETAGLLHPAATLRELAEQLEHHRMHDAQLSPERILQLIGEVEARLGSLAEPSAPAPAHVVAGSPEREVRGKNGRFQGLGAEYQHVGGWNQLRVHLLDLRTGAVSSLRAQADDTESRLVHPADLFARRVNHVTLADWAGGVSLVPVTRRTGNQLAFGLGRVSVAPAGGFDRVATGAVSPQTFAEVSAALPDLPDVLGARNSTDAVMLVPIAAASEVHLDAGLSVLRARLTDDEGATCALRLTWSPRTAAGASALQRALSDESATPLAIAGRWSRGRTGLRVQPTALWTTAGLCLPQVDSGDGGGLDVAAASATEPWEATWARISDLLGQLLVLGGRRGADRLGREYAALSVSLQARGMARTADLVAELAESLGIPERRRPAVAALCLRLALLD